jgi:protein-S-isoprenylcysteine O-methyltransferase Ste14
MMIKIISIAAFCLLSVVLFILLVILKLNGKGSLGKPSLPIYIFIIGKLSMFTCMGSYIYAVLKSNYINPVFNIRITDIAFAIFLAGMFFTFAGLVNLGMALRMGLPNEETELETKGIYRLSRNPIYVGFNLICLASALYFPEIYNVLLFFVVCIYNHFVIRAEESFLEKRFGNSWKDYMKKTRRYL